MPIHLIEYAYLNVPSKYAEELLSLFPSYLDEVREDCHTSFECENFTDPFVEIPLNPCGKDFVMRDLVKLGIPFHLQHVFTEDLFITHVYAINKDTYPAVREIQSTDCMVHPIKGKLTKGMMETKYFNKMLKPDIGFINKVIKAQEVIHTLTSTITSLDTVDLKGIYNEYYSVKPS